MDSPDDTTAKVEEIRERLEASGLRGADWRPYENEGGQCEVRDYGDGIYRLLAGSISGRQRAEFIAHAPEDITLLLGELDYLTAEYAKLAAIAEDGFVQRERACEALRARLAEAEAAVSSAVEGREALRAMFTRANTRLSDVKAERDTLRAEVERLKALTQAGLLSCPDCEWSGQEADLTEKMSGALCPSCSRVLRWWGGLRVSVAELEELPSREEAAAELRAAGLEPGKVGRELRLRLEASAARLGLQSLLIEDWEMPEAPEESLPRGPLQPGAIWVEGFGWDLRWCWADGVPTSHLIQDPFREGVEVTADMLRALGFTVEEG